VTETNPFIGKQNSSNNRIASPIRSYGATSRSLDVLIKSGNSQTGAAGHLKNKALFAMDYDALANQKEISFFSERLGKQISGTYLLLGRMMTVTAADGRRKNAPLGGTPPEILARLTLVELEAAKPE